MFLNTGKKEGFILETFDLYSSIGFALVNTSFRAKQALTASFQKQGLDSTVDQLVILSALLNENAITQTKLCEKTCKNNSNLTRIINGMEEKGLVTREKGHDGRSRIVCISDKGMALYESLVPIANGYMTQIFSEFSDEEKELLRGMLARINNQI